MAYRGKSLKAVREAKQIKLRRIAEETRIGLAYLTDLEAERYDRFPGKFYFKSFTREYARSLGLDPTEVVDDLQMAYEEWSGGDTNSRVPQLSQRDQEGILQRITGYLRREQEV